MPPAIHPVDEVLPAPKLAALGLQHVLVMYANAVAVPVILGGALHLPNDQVALHCRLGATCGPGGSGRHHVRHNDGDGDQEPLHGRFCAPTQPRFVAISIGFGLIPIVAPNFFHVFPDALKPIFGDGIILTSITAVSLNAFFNRTSREEAEVGAFLAAQAAEHI
jgi:xanthine/uracil permease